MSEVDEKVLVKVKDALVEALGLEENEVTKKASLARDLGAESIDFLDILFRLEQAFGIKIPRSDLFPEKFASNSTYVQDGKVTAAGLAELKKLFPFTDYSEFEQDPTVSTLADTFTVGSLVGYLSHRLSSEGIQA
jgi:acyl carrier protein